MRRLQAANAVLITFCRFVSGGQFHDEPDSLSWYHKEVDLLAQLKSRLTGSLNHNLFINHLELELQNFGLKVLADNFEFAYDDGPLGPLGLRIEEQSVAPSMFVPYSGNTNADGVTGELVTIVNPAQGSPDWQHAIGRIAVLKTSNPPFNAEAALAPWPGSPPWGDVAAVPAATANGVVRNLTDAAEMGVKAVIYAWDNVTAANAFGQYGPFKMNYQGIPAIYTAGETTTQIMEAASDGKTATVMLRGSLKSNATTRTLWTLVEGTELKNETVIISTHTDGTNTVEENGHLALLAKARELASSPPRHTTILVFLTGHLHTSGFTDTGRVMQRWLSDHTDLWRGHGPNELTGVFGSCVEHLGAVHWFQDLSYDLYYPTGEFEQEWLYAATEQLTSLLEKEWEGVIPGLRRIINPIKSAPKQEQSGEGLPFLWNNIPEISLVTSPDWLLKLWPENFDERQLLDVTAAKRQVDSFLRIWRAVDGMERADFGKVSYKRPV
ncbi:hypothetical protein NA57DRAFT_70948 [Rhizodiscina lignyota]|uniref:Peptide hydrolase n=1 Tax=Rhizodiscina lignyota TaxID=1504668 RepID=A0A9P4MBK1_9PEZI|nr:hypothetical protein NA57DRAFT_70948 [Rhizodiscina lignyota]